MSPDETAAELTASWINGNRKWVRRQLLSLPQEDAILVALLMGKELRTMASQDTDSLIRFLRLMMGAEVSGKRLAKR